MRAGVVNVEDNVRTAPAIAMLQAMKSFKHKLSTERFIGTDFQVAELVSH